MRFLRLRMLLLGGLPGLCVHGQAPLAAGTLTPESLRQFCASQGTPTCAVPLQGQYTLVLHGDWRVPGSMHLQFAPGSALHIAGGVLQFDGGSIDAPAVSGLFPEPDQVRGLAAARPEWFAVAAASPLPSTALAAAYQTTEPWGTIYLLALQYVSPFSGCLTGPGSLRYLSPRTLVGSGRPLPDDAVNPTQLQGGTVLLGGLMGTAPVRLAHLGIDAGPRMAARTQGCEPPAVFIEQPADHHFVSGDRIEDVSVLTTNGPNMHSVMIAGHDNTEVRGLWIWTLGGTHGLVMKSSNSVVDGLHCWGASADCLIVKSDYATDMLGRAVHDRIAHVDIHPLQPGGEVGGIMVDSSWDAVRSLDMRNITETGTHVGIILLGSDLHSPSDIWIRNWSADDVSGMCLLSNRADRVQVANFRCAVRPSVGAAITLRGGKGIALQQGTLSCDGPAAQCAAGHTDGIRDLATGTSLRRVAGKGLGGYLLRSPQAPSPLDELQADDMAGRVFAVYKEPWGLWVRERAAEIKPSLRILYTAALTRVWLHATLSLWLAALVLLVLGWGMAHRLRRA